MHPIHVHVRYEGGEAVFELIDGVELRSSHGMKLHDLRRAQKMAKQNIQTIIQKWNEYFNQ